MMDRREYMREYKRRYRAAHSLKKYDGDAFLSLSCISVEEADRRGGGLIDAWGLVWDDTTEKTGADVKSLFNALLCVRRKNTVYISNLKVWARFFVKYAADNGFKLSENTKEKNTYRLNVNGVGDWVGFEINQDGEQTFIKNFSEIIRTPLDKALKDFCQMDLKPQSDPILTARCMRLIMRNFKFALVKLSGGIPFNANTISGYAQKLCEIIAGDGCPEYGKQVFKSVFPSLPRSLCDDLRASKVYRSGWNYLAPKALDYTGAGFVLDVRSFYPSIYAKILPYGVPKKFDFKADFYYNSKYCLFHVLELSADLKIGGVPTIQIINDPDTGTKYLNKINYTGGFPFFLDSNDIETLYNNYDINFLTIDYFYQFNVKQIYFMKEYANRLYGLKSRENGSAIGAAAKHLINSLSGRFGINPYRNEVDIIKNKSYAATKTNYVGEIGYLPAAIFINSMGRRIISELARKNKDIFLYSDTDSIFIKGNEIPQNLADLVGTDLGEFSITRFTECKFLGLKCYGYKTLFDGWKWTVSGASPQMLKALDGEAYRGQILKGGVVPKVYPDGTIAFKEREFTLARNIIF